MRFTEHELTAALTGAAKTMLKAQDKEVRKGRVDVETAWDRMDRYQRFQLLDRLGDQLLPVLVALPDVEVAPGSRPTFSDRQVREAVEAQLGNGPAGRVRRAVVVRARTALVQAALAQLPPRID